MLPEREEQGPPLSPRDLRRPGVYGQRGEHKADRNGVCVCVCTYHVYKPKAAHSMEGCFVLRVAPRAGG